MKIRGTSPDKFGCHVVRQQLRRGYINKWGGYDNKLKGRGRHLQPSGNCLRQGTWSGPYWQGRIISSPSQKPSVPFYSSYPNCLSLREVNESTELLNSVQLFVSSNENKLLQITFYINVKSIETFLSWALYICYGITRAWTNFRLSGIQSRTAIIVKWEAKLNNSFSQFVKIIISQIKIIALHALLFDLKSLQKRTEALSR